MKQILLKISVTITVVGLLQPLFGGYKFEQKSGRYYIHLVPEKKTGKAVITRARAARLDISNNTADLASTDVCVFAENLNEATYGARNLVVCKSGRVFKNVNKAAQLFAQEPQAEGEIYIGSYKSNGAMYRITCNSNCTQQ